MIDAQRVLLDTAGEYPKVLREPAPDVFFLGFGDGSLNFELAAWMAEMMFKPRRFRGE